MRTKRGWSFVDANNLRIWWKTPEHAQKAAQLAAHAQKVWDGVVAFMGRAPLADDAIACRSGHGNDAAGGADGVCPDLRLRDLERDGHASIADPCNTGSGNGTASITPETPAERVLVCNTEPGTPQYRVWQVTPSLDVAVAIPFCGGSLDVNAPWLDPRGDPLLIRDDGTIRGNSKWTSQFGVRSSSWHFVPVREP